MKVVSISGRNYLALFLGLVFLLPSLGLAQSQGGPTTLVEAGGPFRGGWWVKTEWGADYALMGDVINGMKAWQADAQAFAVPNTLSVQNWGWQGSFEAGLNLDPDNAFSIEVQQISDPTESFSTTQPSAPNTISVAPTLDGVSLNYYRTLFKGGGFRTYGVIGGGYYHAIVDFYNGSGGTDNGQSATFTGDILGGSLGLGEEMQVLENLSLGLDVKGLLAAFSQVTCNNFNGYGLTQTNGAPYALGIYDKPGAGPLDGTIALYSVPFAGSSLRYAVVDFSGLTANLTLAYHF